MLSIVTPRPLIVHYKPLLQVMKYTTASISGDHGFQQSNSWIYKASCPTNISMKSPRQFLLHYQSWTTAMNGIIRSIIVYYGFSINNRGLRPLFVHYQRLLDSMVRTKTKSVLESLSVDQYVNGTTPTINFM